MKTNPSLKVLVRRQLDALLRFAELPSPVVERTSLTFELLTSKAMDRPARGPFDGLSRINASGLPFQWCLSFGPDPRSVRFLCEAGTPGDSPQQRFDFSLCLLKESIASLAMPDPAWLWENVFAYALPKAGEWPRHWRSALWFGVGASRDGVLIKPYLNLNRDAPIDRWRRIGWVLHSLGKINALARLCDLSSKVSANSWPVGLAIDICPDGSPGRAKIYFRSSAVQPDWLGRWYTAAGADQEATAVRHLLDAFPWCGTAPYQRKSFVVSLEFHGNDGELSLKTDLNITRWVSDDSSIVEGVRRLLFTINLDDAALISSLTSIGAWPPSPDKTECCRFVGLGYEPDGDRHVNVYLEPPLRTRPESKMAYCRQHRHSLSTSLHAGLDYVLSKRNGNRWTDYSLPVGESDQWVTAYVLCQLKALPDTILCHDIKQQLYSSLDWLLKSRTAGGGWGYNSTTDNDADSTSLAVLALRAYGRHAPAEALSVIRRCHAKDGSVATYPQGTAPGGSWTIGITDVTAVAMQAMGEEVTASQCTEAINFLEERQFPDGSWPSFWWLTPLYSTYWVLSWLAGFGRIPRKAQLTATLLRYQPVGAFEAALLSMCMARLGLHKHSLHIIEALIMRQQSIGAWTSSAFLRLTNTNVAEPWNAIDAGSTFVDQNAVFTTATVVAALAQRLG